MVNINLMFVNPEGGGESSKLHLTLILMKFFFVFLKKLISNKIVCFTLSVDLVHLSHSTGVFAYNRLIVYIFFCCHYYLYYYQFHLEVSFVYKQYN